MKKLSSGMVKDSAAVDQPEGSMRDALNANLNFEKGTVTNEYGTTRYITNDDFIVIGKSILDDDRIVLFGKDSATLVEQIRILNPRNNETVVLYENDSLNFKESHPIVCINRKNQSNESLVYFTDGYVKDEEVYTGFNYVSEFNPPRVINITKQEKFRYSGGLVNNLYDINNTRHKLDLIPRIGSHAYIKDIPEVQTGGSLISGAYYLALAYADKDGLETNYFLLTNPVYVVPGSDSTLPSSALIGVEGGAPTNKSIRWKIQIPSNVDYELLQPAVIRMINEEQTAFKIPAKQINVNGTMYVTFSGNENALPISPEDIVVDDVSYIAAESIAQLDNRLYLGNVTANKDIGFQPFAHHIQVHCITEDKPVFNPEVIDTFILNQGYASMLQTFDSNVGRQYFQEYTFDPGTGYAKDPDQNKIIPSYSSILDHYMRNGAGEIPTGYRNVKNSFNKKSYRRNEVYSFYVSFILNDGTETYAYHIPGRNALEVTSSEPVQTITTYDYFADWRVITVRAEDPGDPSNWVAYELPFLYLDPSSSAVTAGGYSAGYHRRNNLGNGGYTAIADADLVNKINTSGNPPESASLPDQAFVESGDPAGGFMSAGFADGGTFGSPAHGGVGTSNTFYDWLINYGPQLTAPLEWVDIANTTNFGFDFEAGIEESATVTDVPDTGGGTVREDDRLDELTPGVMKNVIGFRPEEFLDQNSESKIYQVVDTSYKVDTASGNFMGFWENENETYPNTPDFLKAAVEVDGTVSIDPSLTLAGERVRHHKFPSNLTDRSYIQTASGASNSYYNEQAQPFLLNSTGGILQTVEEAGDNDGLVLAERARIMGIQLKNIKLPKYILEQVQGYKVYYAKRTAGNKTILGQSLAIPGHPRYASVKEQSLEDAIKGPYKKAFYMYGGLDHSSDSAMDTYGDWKGDGSKSSKRYWSHPVFKFHDFNMLRNRVDVSAATHIQCQFGVMFRTYQGGPGIFIDPCDYTKIRDVVKATEDQDDPSNISYSSYNSIAREDQYTTTFPSVGWVSPEMRNTVDFYWHDPLHLGASIDAEDKKLLGESRILDISDVIEGSADLVTDGASLANEGIDISDVKPAKRARMYRRGEDLSQPADLDAVYNDKIERLLACEAKAARVRAFFTSAMVATAYITPASVLNNKHNIKAGDYKQHSMDTDASPTTQSVTPYLNRFYAEGDFDNNQLIFTIDPASRILLTGKQDYESDNASAFKGASYLYNRAGETAFAFGLTSGLPALRGHLPYWNPSDIDGTNRIDLTSWGQNHRWLYPDAAIDPIPISYQRFGWSNQFFGTNNNDNLYPPEEFRGLKYSMTLGNPFNGHPMAWLVNVCSLKTDVYNPFDRQQLVWTGYSKPILNVNTANGAASDYDGNTVNYYVGGESDYIYGGDTYITRYSFRSTSQSYGHSYFRASPLYDDGMASSIQYENAGATYDAGLGAYLNNNVITTSNKRFQGDLPTNLDPSKTGASTLNRFGTTNNVPIWNWTASLAVSASDEYEEAYDAALATLQVAKDTWNWQKGTVNPVSTLFTFMVESDDLIEFRHVSDTEKGEDTKMFPYHTARSVIFTPPTEDYTDPDKLMYSNHFSGVQDMKVTFPLPTYEDLTKNQLFPRRIVRSDVDSGDLADGYRKFRALNYKDIPSQRGDIKSLFDYRGVLYIHTNRSLFLTQGKEELQIGAANAFVGSGDIFTQDPSEVQESTVGYGGTTSRHCNVTTQHGHFYLNYRERKVYKAGGDGIKDISPGMEKWLRENMPFTVEQYGINLDSAEAQANGFYVDSPMGLSVPIGFTMGYDPLFKRLLITKREPIPTQTFLDEFTAGNITIQNNIPYFQDDDCLDPPTPVVGDDPASLNRQTGTVYCGPISFGNPTYFTQGGWTISYYPDYGIWGSRHSYLPSLYAHTSEYMISFGKGVTPDGTEVWGSWEHTNKENPGRFYGNLYNFEIEFIDNTAKAEPKLYSNVYYWAESTSTNTSSLTQSNRITNTVFDSYYAYNSTQITGSPTTINYLNNARLVDRVWYINELRDMAKTEVLTEGELITNTENVAGYITSSVTTHLQGTTMFTEEGVVNPNYINRSKEWYTRRKMNDHFLGVRLIHDNSNRNLVHLYAVGTKFRKSYR